MKRASISFSMRSASTCLTRFSSASASSSAVALVTVKIDLSDFADDDSEEEEEEGGAVTLDNSVTTTGRRSLIQRGRAALQTSAPAAAAKPPPPAPADDVPRSARSGDFRSLPRLATFTQAATAAPAAVSLLLRPRVLSSPPGRVRRAGATATATSPPRVRGKSPAYIASKTVANARTDVNSAGSSPNSARARFLSAVHRSHDASTSGTSSNNSAMPAAFLSGSLGSSTDAIRSSLGGAPSTIAPGSPLWWQRNLRHYEAKAAATAVKASAAATHHVPTSSGSGGTVSVADARVLASFSQRNGPGVLHAYNDDEAAATTVSLPDADEGTAKLTENRYILAATDTAPPLPRPTASGNNRLAVLLAATYMQDQHAR